MAEVTVNVVYAVEPPGFELSTFALDGLTFVAEPGASRVSVRLDDGGSSSKALKKRVEGLLLLRSFECLFEYGRAVTFSVNDVRSESHSPAGGRVISIDLEDTLQFVEPPVIGVTSRRASDTTRIRDRIVLSCLAKGDSAVASVLSQDGTVLRAVEYFVEAALDREHQMAELYNVIELITNRLHGGDRGVEKIGLTKGFIDYVKRRANQAEHDERHPPKDLTAIQPLTHAERDECVKRTRTVIEEYAKARLDGRVG